MKKSAPLSQSQLGIYAECVHHENEVFYNLPFLYVFDGSIDADRLCRAIEATIQAHPVFFTRIELSDEGEPLQTIDLEKEEFSLSVEQVTDLEAEKKKFIEPFQLHGGRLFHTKVMRDAEHVYWLFDMHHIISDGSSYHIIVCDVETAYNGGALAPEAMSMQELAIAEAEMRKTPAFEEGKQWYAQNFDCGDTFTQLMPDLEIPEQTDASKLRILGTDMDRVDAFCKTNGIKKSTFFTSAFSFLLAKYNNDQESLFTTVFNGRTDPKFQHSVGMTVKTLPVYAKFTEETTVLDFLKASEEQMIGCRKHDLYSYTDIMNDLNLQTNAIFAWHGLILDFTELMGKPMEAIQLRKHNEDVSFYLMAFYVGKKYHIKAEYKSNEYSETLVDQFMESYEAVLEGFLSQTLLRDIDICTESQRALLDSFNQTDVPYDETQTIVSLFRQQAKSTPDNIAVVFKDKRFTYSELDEISDRIAAYIHGKGLHEEDVVSVLIPRCEWMPIVSMGVLKAGCAYQPLDPTYPSERLNFMMQDASVKLLIADEELRPIVDEYQGEVLFTKDIASLPAVETFPETSLPKPSSLFIMLYTSGTTGTPKGCQIEHRNLVTFCKWYQHRFSLDSGCKITAYASYGFDANMMETYPALTSGATIYIIPEELRLDMIALNEYFEQEQITHGFMTTQVAYQFATSIENHCLHYLLTGGEKLAPLTPPTNYILVNCYGPTESTICITTFDVTKSMKDIPIGSALDNVKLYIVDKAGHRLPVGVAGELWVAGPQVTRGYLNRPEKTAEVYIDNPFDSSEKYAHIYRTGDIVRYLPDGNIQFVGRKDGQVKIRGFRIELKEVESIVRQFPGIKDATVQAFDEEGGGKFIAAYIVADEQIDIEALNNFIMDEKPPYMVPAVTMQIDRIPLNQNQKVNKKALPKPEKKATEAVVESNVPMNVLEQEIHDIIAKIINTEDFGVTTVLGYAGLTSIMAIKLAIQINKRFGVTLDSKSLAKTGTLQSIENEILNYMLNAPTATQTTSSSDNCQLSTVNCQLKNAPLSYAQMGVYVDCMKQPTATVYNIPTLIRFPKDTDVQLLEKSIATLIKAHPQFFVHFDSEAGEIVQIVDKNQALAISKNQLNETELEKYKVDFVKPFNLRQGPLYRMEIVTTEQNVCLLADVHHLIFDGGSLDLFLNQLCDLMNGKEIEAEAISYANFVADEKAAENTPSYTEAKNFFNERLGKVEGVTEVPTDLTNPLTQGTVSETFCKMDFNAMEEFCKKNNLSPAHLTLAAVFYTLSRFTNNEQICITTISNGRSDLRISNTTGMFVNTLALSAQLGDQKVMDFLKETSQNFDETLTHEKYPFSQIAADYDLSAEIMFAYQMGVINQYVVKGQKLEIESLELNTPKFRIAFYIQEKEGVPGVVVEYDNGRYSHELMQSLAQSVCNAAKAFISHPEMALQQVSLLDAEQTAMLDSFNQTDVPYDDTQTIVSLFRKQVQQTPDNLAVVYHDHKYTYREVDEISERIAGYIVSQGLGDEDVVSVLIPRCEWMAIVSLGVLKAGCAYQPLDPSYPAERLNFMIQDANAKLLIADEELRSIVDEYQGKVLLTKDIATLENVETFHETSLPTPSSLFIMLYTSGSTGTPKGCQLEHGNLVAFCHWYQRHYGLTAADRVAAYASYGFDACMMDMYPALTCGACVYIIGDDIRLNLPDLNDYFNAQGITHSFITTQVGYQFVTNVENHSLRCFAVGGEKLSALNPPTNYKMYNGYGPTECTVFTTNYWVKDYELDIPIGKPLDNLRLYIVDKQFNRLPLGAAGELWVTGPQVSRGYLNRPEKNAETYLKNPFDDDPKHARVYRTGDIVRYLPDGNIQFVGRKDGQVKIRGFRIELKEVEAVIRQFPGIKDATVQAFDYENGGKYIAAYIVSDQQVDIKALNAFIGERKPPYMIPASTMQIDSIPLNQNQKVNRKALPTPVMQASDREYVAPANDTEALFCRIFSEVLSMDKIGANDSFFDLGGTSLMVTRVIIEADKAGMHVAYGDVFANATPRKLAALVTGSTVVDTDDEDITKFDYSGINKLLSNNTLDSFRNGERQSLGNVLLTGATGYLGIHVLQELIQSDAQNIYCLVRDKSMDAAEHRLKTLLFYYFESTYDELFGKRLHIVLGDVTNDLTTLVQAKIDTVFNCAAVVKHFSEGTEIEDVNVGGAQRCVDLCLKTGARLVHISTYSTSGLNVNDTMDPDYVFTEQRLYDGQYLGNQYVHSKFLAERIVLQSIVEDGLSAKVIRVGNLAARTSDGEFQINFSTNSFMGRIKVFNMLGCFPYSLYESKVEFSPIDEMAHAIILLSSTPKECCLFHSYNSHMQFLGDVLSGFNKLGADIRLVEDEEYNATMESAGNDPQKAKTLSSLLAYQDMAHGMKVKEVAVSNPYTTQVLYRLGFKWSPTTWDYVDRMLSAISGLGFFD
ncbi:MAG: amino acid adenylation domain-containing protein [Bacteroidales bacterium]|nr:amino acid adenylation domain-containing protein [Bacteroidales bacterium]